VAIFVLVDPTNKKVRVDNGGKAFVQDNVDCPDVAHCCFQCVEIWFSMWDCTEGGWTDPAYLGPGCVPDNWQTDMWTRDPRFTRDDPCFLYYFALCNDPICDSQADCESCRDENLAPSAPLTADRTSECCEAGCPCPNTEVDCGCGTRGDPESSFTPARIALGFFDIQSSPKCSRLTDAPFENFKIDLSGLNGHSYQITIGAECRGSVDVPVRVLKCDGEGDPDANNCQCVPNEDVTTSAKIWLGQSLDTGFTGTLFLEVIYDVRGVPAVLHFPLDFTACCNEEAESLPDADGTENWYDLLSGVIVKTPCGGG
jgi:hypothetical protein